MSAIQDDYHRQSDALRSPLPEGVEPPSLESMRQLICELRERLSEVERQNEELRHELKERQAVSERYYDLYTMAPLGYQSMNEDGCLLDVNPAWLALLGYRREEVIGKWFGEFLAADYVGVFKDRFPLFKAAGRMHSEFQVMHKDGSLRFIAFDGRISYNPDGSFRQTHCILSDISTHKQVDEKLASQLDELRRWQEVTFGRESRIGELKREVNELAVKQGEKPRYGSVNA
jgi:PAS domain S-box-containing protein